MNTMILRRYKNIKNEVHNIAIEKPDFDEMKKDELIAYAKANNIAINESLKKADIIKIIKNQ